jgi:hypothetical protein
MTLNAKDYALRPRQAEWEHDLARELRAFPEAVRLQFVLELLPHQLILALDLARKCLQEKHSLESVLERGLAEGDSSTIQEWLKCVLPHLGVRHVVRYLQENASRYPKGVQSAAYWLPGLLQESERSKVDWSALSAS